MTVCSTCNDTHKMQHDGRMVMCTRCPWPCESCCAPGSPYCAATPCSCECHPRRAAAVAALLNPAPTAVDRCGHCEMGVSCDRESGHRGAHGSGIVAELSRVTAERDKLAAQLADDDKLAARLTAAAEQRPALLARHAADLLTELTRLRADHNALTARTRELEQQRTAAEQERDAERAHANEWLTQLHDARKISAALGKERDALRGELRDVMLARDHALLQVKRLQSANANAQADTGAAATSAPCLNNSPSWFTGRWRDWHRGHGCDKDDGEPRTAEAEREIAAHRDTP